MRGAPLRVEQFVASRLQPLDQPDQRHLGSSGYDVEHGLPKKNASHGDAVQAAGQLAVPPDFHGMGMAQVEEPKVTLYDCLVDPGILAPRAGSHDLLEGGIDPQFPGGVPQRLPGAVGHMKGIQGNDPARVGREAPDRPIVHRHGKPTGGVKPE